MAPGFRDFEFILGGKLPRKLGAGEKFLRDSIVPILGSVIDISGIFENGLRFEPSHEHAGLQIADIVAYVVRYAAVNPDDERGQPPTT